MFDFFFSLLLSFPFLILFGAVIVKSNSKREDGLNSQKHDEKLARLQDTLKSEPLLVPTFPPQTPYLDSQNGNLGIKRPLPTTYSERTEFKVSMNAEITYLDSKGALSERTITVTGVGPDFIRAFCHKRKARRTFLISRIKSFINTGTGEIISTQKVFEHLKSFSEKESSQKANTRDGRKTAYKGKKLTSTAT